MTAKTIWLLSGDLMFGSRVRAAAEAAGYAFRMSGNLPPERTTADDANAPTTDVEADQPPDLAWIVLDLATRSNLLPAIYTVGSQRFPTARWIAFGPHVQVGKLKAARAAGIETVLTRGQFDAQLGTLFTA